MSVSDMQLCVCHISSVPVVYVINNNSLLCIGLSARSLISVMQN